MSGTTKQQSTRTPKGKSSPNPKHRVSGSEMLRVSSEFAELVRRLSSKYGTSIPDITRNMAAESDE